MKIATKLKLGFIVPVAVLGAIVTTVWAIGSQRIGARTAALVDKQAVETGTGMAMLIASTRAQYAKRIVSSLKPHGVAFGVDPKAGEAPLPATFISMVSAHLAEKSGGNGVSFGLRSGWNINKGQGIATDFEKKGWQDLLMQAQRDGKSGSYKPYHERGTNENGEAIMRIMTADLASAPSCVSCHNKLEETPEVLAMRGSSTPKVFRLGDLMGAIVTTVPLSTAQTMVASSLAAQDRLGFILYTSIAVIILLALLLSIPMGNRLVSPIKQATALIEEASEGSGDLTKQLEESGNDEIAHLCRSYNAFIDKIRNLIQQTHHLSSSLATRAQENSHSSNGLAQSASTQAASLEEISAALVQMDSVSKSASEQASLASKSSAMTAKALQTAESHMSELESAMGGILRSSSEVRRAVNVIDELAFQTNLLALNAAVEAARAGESGKGFSVVAEEVRSLAKRSAEAAKDISSIIENSDRQTQSGVSLTEKVSEAVKVCIDEGRGVDQMVDKIAMAAQEQSQSMDQVNSSIATVDQLTQRNAAASEELAATAQKTQDDLSTLQNLVGQFQA